MAVSTIPLRRTLPAFRDYVSSLWRRREFAWYLALGQIKARNASTTLGLLWWVLNPLLLGAVYILVFGYMLNVSRGRDDYVAYLLSGIFAFYFTRSAVLSGASSVISNARLVANLRFPRLVLPISAIIEGAIGFLLSLAVFYLIAWPSNGVLPSWTVVWLVPAFVMHLLFNFGLSAAVARLAIPFRDVTNLIPYAVRIWFYLSPVILPAEIYLNSRFPPALTAVVEWNPMFSLLSIYRHALLGDPLFPHVVERSIFWAVVAVLVGVTAFIKYERNMARYL